MKKEKNNFRWFRFLNPVDLIITAGVIAAVVWAALVFSAPTSVSAKESDVRIRYTVELKEREEGAFTRVITGAALFDTLHNYNIGTVVGAYAEPYREDAPDEESGIIRRPAVEGLEFLYIVVEANAQITDYATSVGSYDVLVNKEVFVYSKSFAGQGYITSLERMN